MQILHRDDLKLGGFAGLKEHRLVTDSRLFGGYKSPAAWNGIGSFVYLADARFLPKGETRMHDHREIDVISVMVEGRIAHEGSLEHGQLLENQQVQVQRAGGEGFSHNEINPDDRENRMIQLWFLPEIASQPAGYKLYTAEVGGLTRVYGGNTDQEETFASNTLVDSGVIPAGRTVSLSGEFISYLTIGSGILNGQLVRDGDLIRDRDLEFKAESSVQLIVIHLSQES
jgi:hypothetical protein